MSKQLTELGKRLSEISIEIDVPHISLLGIKGGKQTVQSFLYWNFLKCYWNQELGRESSDMINFNWYSPPNAKRYHKEKFRNMISGNNLKIMYFHKEEACCSGRLEKTNSSLK